MAGRRVWLTIRKPFGENIVLLGFDSKIKQEEFASKLEHTSSNIEVIIGSAITDLASIKRNWKDYRINVLENDAEEYDFNYVVDTIKSLLKSERKESITVKESFRIPGTDIIVEKGQELTVFEARGSRYYWVILSRNKGDREVVVVGYLDENSRDDFAKEMTDLGVAGYSIATQVPLSTLRKAGGNKIIKVLKMDEVTVSEKELRNTIFTALHMPHLKEKDGKYFSTEN